MKTVCPFCKSKFEVDNSFENQEAKCPSCENDFIIIPENESLSNILKPQDEKIRGKNSSDTIVSQEKFMKNESEKNDTLLEDEHILWAGHPSQCSNFLYFSLLPILFLFGIFCCVMFFLESDLKILLVIGFLLILFPILFFFYLWKSTMSTIYKITNNKIFVKTGIFGSEERYANIQDIRNISLSQGFSDSFLGIGNISIYTSASTEDQIYFCGIKNYKKIAELIENQRNPQKKT